MLFFLLLALCLSTSNSSGNSELGDRIIGGVAANIAYFPYQISLQNKKGHFCGGAIIHQTYVLTAAHCLENETIKSLNIRAGSHFHNKQGILRNVCSAIIHESYKGEETDYDNDVAILRLCKGLTFNSTVLPVALPQFTDIIKDNATAVVSGWGYNGKSNAPIKLLTADLVTVNQQFCRRQYKSLGKVTIRMICATCKKGICDSCDGDSGGPLVANGQLIGITSWGYECANKEYPGVYTRVSKFRKWIKNKIGI